MSFQKNYAAGIVPYFMKHGECYILIGKDRISKKWSGFSGSQEPTDKDYHATALREFYEETSGTFDMEIFEQKMKNHDYMLLKSETPKGNDYFNFFIEITHMYTMDYFPKKFLVNVDSYTDSIFREKIYIRWTRLNDIIYKDPLKKTFVVTNNFLKDVVLFHSKKYGTSIY